MTLDQVVGVRIPARQPPHPAFPAPADLLPLSRLLARLDPSADPVALGVCGPSPAPGQPLVVLSGSFNPPHVAHLALLRSGLAAVAGALGLFLLSARTVDKERVSGLLLEDRLWLLCSLAADPSWRDGKGDAGVVATNKGLYVEQATAVRGLAPAGEARPIHFVVGYDKIVQILDRRYYEHRERSLNRLFEQARFLVAPRDEFTAESLGELLEAPENRRYALWIRPLPLEETLRHVSSTAARQASEAEAPLEGRVPALVERFLGVARPYAVGDEGSYAARATALAALGEG